MHTVRIANLVTPTSGGIRTTLSALRHADVAAGHRVTEIVAGPAHDHEVLEDGTERRTLPGRPLPGGAGYRVLTDRTAVRAALAAAAADHVEVHDRTTLGWVAGWARARGLSATVVVHERSLGALRTWARIGPLRAPDPLLRVLARSFDAALVATAGRTVVASRYAARAFAHVPTADVEVVRWGVDLDAFAPAASVDVRHRGGIRLVSVGRLSREKRPESAVAVLATLVASGAAAELHVVGDGPERDALRRAAAGLPVTWHGHLDRAGVVAQLRAADVALAGCPIETFGLAALEALACGTPVVVPPRGALPELLEDAHPAAGSVAADTGPRTAADAVTEVVSYDRRTRQRAARAVALAHPWERAAAALRAGVDVAPLPRRLAGVTRRPPAPR